MKKYLFIVALSLSLFWGSQARAGDTVLNSTKVREALVDMFTFNTDDTIDLTITGTTTVPGSVLASTGTLTLGGTGGTNNENLLYNFEVAANKVNITSGTGVTEINYPNDFAHSWGVTNDFRIVWETSAAVNENLQMGIRSGDASGSGYFSLMESADLGNTNRSPISTWPNGATPADPTWAVLSADATEALDILAFWHDQSDANIGWGNGYLALNDNGTDTARFDWSGAGSDTAMLLLDAGGTIRRVTTGINNSAGAGFRELRIVNE